MKTLFKFSYTFLAAILLSCAGNKTAETPEEADAGTQVYSFKDSCEHLVVSLSLELPLGTDSASMQIRDSLISDFIRGAQQPGYEEDGANSIKPFNGDMGNGQAIVNYYGKACYDKLMDQALNDYKQRTEFLDEDTTMTAEDKTRIREDIPQWAFDFAVKKLTDTLDFVVYNSQAYVYYGGAHGGITGSGALTFSKTDGSMVSQFINPDATQAIQPLIRKGLLLYYKDAGDPITDKELSERLQIEGKTIPQPQQTPYPNATRDSLVFTYGQYEIACYADGMPSFTIAVKDLLPHLTKKGASLLNMKAE